MKTSSITSILFEMGINPNGKTFTTIGNKTLIKEGSELILTINTPSKSMWNTISGGSFTSK